MCDATIDTEMCTPLRSIKINGRFNGINLNAQFVIEHSFVGKSKFYVS